MKILTTDNRMLTVISIGAFDRSGDSESNGTTTIYCKTEGGRKKAVDISEVKCFFGSYFFPPEKL